MTLASIDSRIDEINKKINDIEARPTEVYSRIVGYYRSVKNWNNGKSAEYKVRKTFMEPETQPCQPPIVNVEETVAVEASPAAEVTATESAVKEEVAAKVVAPAEEQDDQADLFAMDAPETAPAGEEVGTYSFFYRNTCPNCPPVKELIADFKWEGSHINVDEEEGLNAAVKHNVFTAPTVILFSPTGDEIFRTDNAAGLREYIEAGTAAAV